jgi:hypothetical protein
MKKFRISISVLVFAIVAVFTHCDSNTEDDNLSQLTLMSVIAGSYSDIQLSSIDPPSGDTNNHILSTNVLIIFDGDLDDTIKGTVQIGDITFEDGVNCTITFPGVNDRIVINPNDDFGDGSHFLGLKIRNFKDTAGKTIKITDSEYSIGFRMV